MRARRLARRARRIPSAVRRIEEDLVLFESWHGRYADNPRAISEELRRRGSGHRHLWVLEPGTGDVLPDDVETVEPDGIAYLQALGRARCLVSNNTLPGYFAKKRGQDYLQTWHGTPLKRIAFDVPNAGFDASGRYLADLVHDVAAWDRLISPNRVSTQIFRDAFRYRGEIVETGYPRNDLLSSPEAEHVRAATRAQLGIADGTRAVLYAPTWRDGDAFSLELDVQRVAEAMGEGHVVLVRAHQLVAAHLDLRERPGVRDVSALADIRELYLAADALITDYSSVMFDFAVTRKPILLYTYDLARYRDVLRGFYFDLEREGPGPLLASSDEVIAALEDLDAVAGKHASAYEAFHERFCHLEDGHAAARVVDATFGG